ncbi:sodium channel modifier 1 [Spea bombifrons]|uniref:sodium channel modifier 1 n=1 Tax=Spea bombifrons TaxID=233779 RepID=UPI00234AB645|nr:sodium channel modifier 1 [Spea bombifrons]
MAFKRDGDDKSQLNVLKKRRVSDLLASFIPEDEALLLTNGRYTCTVCVHRPVFDTIEMLSVHRNGKKHVAGLQRFYWKKETYKNEIQKSQHQKLGQAEEHGEQSPRGPAPLLTQTRRITQHALLKATPYNSCCSRNRSDAVGKKASIFGDSSSSLLVNLSQNVQQGPLQQHNLSAPYATAELSQPGQNESSTDGDLERIPRVNRGNRKFRVQRSVTGNGGGSETDRGRVLEHYLQLKSSGWIPDGTGKWVKDQNVEFDSDEEEPSVFPPP